MNLVDPSGMIACTKSNDPECITLINDLKVNAQNIRNAVKQGTLLPVEGFAQFADSVSRACMQNQKRENRSERNHGREISSSFFIACGNAAELLETINKTLDNISLS